MRTIQPFIDLGFYTVPLAGELRRLDSGKKTTPIFEPNWKAKYQAEFNLNPAELGGVITGSISDIIAIDCDNQDTFDIFNTLDPANPWIFHSRAKPEGGGTIVYRYVDIPTFKLADDNLQLDFFSDNGFIYLPTDMNDSKHSWDQEEMKDLPPLQEAPQRVIKLLSTLYSQSSRAKEPLVTPATRQRIRAAYLAPQIELMLAKGAFLPSVFRVLTPKDFRELEQYVRFGYLHPNNVPEGRGSEYLSKISAILGSDPSISSELYTKAMLFINDFWDSPLPKSRLEKTIIEPMLSGSASINGEQLWTHDEYWQTKGVPYTTKHGEAAEVFFDDVRATYYIVNHGTQTLKTFDKDSECYSFMEVTGQAIPTRKDFKAIIPLVKTTSDPSKEFGFFAHDEYTRGFNTFCQTPELAILNHPAQYAELYKKPVHIINYFKTLVPDQHMRHYLLRFLKRKLTTFKYSPVILYFLGAHGSGKDTLVNILGEILGQASIARPTTKEFLEHFNGWIIDTYFTQLDEYGNQLSKVTDKQEALGKIKAYSGKQTIQIRQMRTDGFSYNHNSTFILTANTNPLILEDGDRRMAFFNTPNVLKDAEWVQEAGGMTAAYEAIMSEIKDFCYYLATEVDALSYDDYMSPPVTEQKHEIIAARLPAAYRISYWLKHRLFSQFEHTCYIHDSLDVFNYAAEGKIYEEPLFELYQKLTEYNGHKRGLTAALADIDKTPTTRNGMKAYYYNVPSLASYVRKHLFAEADDNQEIAGV